MRRRAAVLAALVAAALLAAGTAAAEPAAAGVGAALFAGEELSARLPAMGNVALQGRAAACGRCHGEDARGRSDGGVPAPPVRWRVLSEPSAARPAYDADALRRALNEGLDPSGRPLHPFMPRYAVTPEQAAALARHLADGVERGHPAATEAELRLLVPHPPGDEAVPALLDALWAEPARRAWGRRLRAVPLPLPEAGAEAGAVEAAPPALAAVGGPGPRRAPGLDAALARRGLPHLFPVDGYPAPPEAPGVVLAEAPLSAQVALLRRAAEAAGQAAPAVLCGGPAGRDAAADCARSPPPGATAFLLPERAAAPGWWRGLPWRLPRGATLYAPLDEAGAALGLDPAARDFALVLADPRGRAMPVAVLEELRRAAPDMLAARPELARRVHAAAALVALAAQRAGPRPAPPGLLAAAGAVPAGEAGALAGPWRDGVRGDGSYGVQVLRLAPHATGASPEGEWSRLR